MTKQNKNDRFLLLFEIYSTDNHMTKQSIILKNSGTSICAPKKIIFKNYPIFL